MTPPRTLVVTAGGDGMRFRPFTSVVPKEMLPINGKPAVHHVVDEGVHAGFTRIIVVTRPDDTIIRDYFASVRMPDVELLCVAEDRGFGYGNAVPLLSVRSELTDESSFAVAFGDDVLLGGADLCRMRHLALSSACTIAATPIGAAEVGQFGLAIRKPGSGDLDRIIQRPRPEQVPSHPHAIVSRIVCSSRIFQYLHKDHKLGELDLGLAVGAMARAARVAVHEVEGVWVTVGDPAKYMEAQLAAADTASCPTCANARL